jgi:hypothetical protein
VRIEVRRRVLAVMAGPAATEVLPESGEILEQ